MQALHPVGLTSLTKLIVLFGFGIILNVGKSNIDLDKKTLPKINSIIDSAVAVAIEDGFAEVDSQANDLSNDDVSVTTSSG